MSVTLKEWFKKTFNKKFTMSNIEKILIESSSVYYNSGDKLIADKDFDSLKEFYEKKTGSIFPVGAPAIGATLNLDHSYSEFAGTLSKCKSINDVKTWIKNKKLNPTELIVSIKADGHSITVEYVYDSKKKKPVIHKALTRGADGKGKDLTSIFKKNEKLVPTPNLDFDFAVGYEAIVTYENFDKLKKEGKRDYKNPRSVINGIFSTKGQELFKYITLLPIKIKAKETTNHIARIDELLILEETDNSGFLDFQVVSINDIEEIYNAHESNRTNPETNEIAFMYDGLVIETYNEDLRKKLGHSSTEPNYATALKFTPAEQTTTVKDIIWSVEGHSGRYTPVVIFDEVMIGGNTYKQVSLANYARFKELALSKGDEIVFTLRNDTLGYVDRLPTSKRSSKIATALTHPDTCISCQDTLTNDEVFLYCENSECALNQIGDLYAFIEKSGIKNIGLEMVRKMYNASIITYPSDLLFLAEEDIIGLEGFGKVSARNIVKEILKIHTIKDYILLGSLNIPNVSRTRSKLILENVSLNSLLESAHANDFTEVTNKLLTVNGIGEEIINSLTKGLFINEEMLRLMITHLNVQYSSLKAENFVQLSFCHTGDANPLKDRNELKDLIENAGHKLVGGVSKNTSYLINNDTMSTTSKNKKANELNIPIISVSDALTKLN